MSQEQEFMYRAIELAEQAVRHGNHPFGALLVHDGKIILEAENSVHTEKDVTRHAELNLVSKASQTIDPEVLKECILYTSTEPCAMCSGAIYWAGIRKVVYATSAKTLDKVAGHGIDIAAETIFDSTHPKVEIVGPVHEDKADELHWSYWPNLGTEAHSIQSHANNTINMDG